MPTISVIIPTFNRAGHLGNAIDSVLRQSYKDIEIIVVDDGSRDHTIEVVGRYINKYPGVFKYIYQNNAGPAAARNIGLDAASGRYVAFLDSDDEYLADKLCKQILFLEKSGCDMVCSDMQETSNGEMTVRSYFRECCSHIFTVNDVYEKLLNYNFIFTPTVIIKKDILNKVGYFDRSLKIAEDYDLWLRVAEKYKIEIMPDVLVTRHKNTANISSDYALHLKSRILVLRRVFQAAVLKRYKSVVARRLGEDYFSLAYYLFENKQYLESRIFFINSLGFSKHKILSFLYLVATLFSPDFVKRIKYLLFWKRFNIGMRL
jgi:glycosyltransferase involved in cell wall biosynthesis